MPWETAVQYQAVITPQGVSWPEWPIEKPVWTGAQAMDPGEADRFFDVPSETATDYYVVSAECGNTLSASMVVFAVGLLAVDPIEVVELGEDVSVDYVVLPDDLDLDDVELRVHNDDEVLIYADDTLQATGGEHLSSWPGAKWNQPPHAGAFALPLGGPYRLTVAGTKSGREHVSVPESLWTHFVVEADILDPPSGSAGASSGLADLGAALEIEVFKGATVHTFSGEAIAYTSIANGRRIRVEATVLNNVEPGTWTVRLKDVRDDVGNFHDANPGTQDIDHDEWTVSLQ